MKLAESIETNFEKCNNCLWDCACKIPVENINNCSDYVPLITQSVMINK